jgi:hypothetical protein
MDFASMKLVPRSNQQELEYRKLVYQHSFGVKGSLNQIHYSENDKNETDVCNHFIRYRYYLILPDLPFRFKHSALLFSCEESREC